VVAPLNRIGDLKPASCEEGAVHTTEGFREAFRQFGEGGWQGLQHDPEFGGQGLPRLLSAATTETLNSANLSFALCPLLTDGVIEALSTAGPTDPRPRSVPPLRGARRT